MDYIVSLLCETTRRNSSWSYDVDYYVISLPSLKVSCQKNFQLVMKNYHVVLYEGDSAV